MAFEKISVPSAKECFFESIKAKILSGELRPGEKLPSERELAESTGINKSAIHLAIKDLERTGFLSIVPRHGTYVADYVASGNYDTLHELLRSGESYLTRQRTVALVETRNAIEGGALIRLAPPPHPPSHTEDDIRVLEEHVERFRASRGKGLSDVRLGEMTKDFHYLICKLSGNEVFILIMNSFSEISRGLWRHCAGHWGLEGLIEQSEHIVELIRSGRGLDAQVYITDKFNEFVRDCGIVF